jgi:hypothetical protein
LRNVHFNPPTPARYVIEPDQALRGRYTFGRRALAVAIHKLDFSPQGPAASVDLVGGQSGALQGECAILALLIRQSS